MERQLKCAVSQGILTFPLKHEAGLVFQGKSQDTLAYSAFQLALHVLLLVAEEPGAVTPELRRGIATLRERLPAEELNAPTRELLARYEESSAS